MISKPYYYKTDVLHLIVTSCEFIVKEVTSLAKGNHVQCSDLTDNVRNVGKTFYAVLTLSLVREV